MHSIWFNLRVQRPVTLDDVIEKLAANPYVALTHKIMAGPIFSFGRNHGYFGRLLNQTVVSIPTLTVRDGHEITGFCSHSTGRQFAPEQCRGGCMAARSSHLR